MVDRSYELFSRDGNRIDDTNADEWRRYFLLEEDLARRSPNQFDRYTERISRKEEGNGWLETKWKG